jgi:hypothetical protein
LLGPEDLVLRILKLQPVRRQLEAPEENHPLMWTEYIIEEGLVEPDCAQRAGAVPHHQLEDLEPRSARRPHAAAHHLADNRRLHARLERRDCAEVPAILVADRKSIQQIFDGVETDALQIGGAPRPDSL